jgi:AhpC/TSA family/Disulphide bond corrector protein DsbC
MGLAAISYDPVDVLADFTKRRGITFPLLSDAGSAVIRQYGILNTTVPSTNQQQYGIPFPGTFILNAKGVVTSRLFEAAYQERDTIASVMVRFGNRMNAPATQLTAAHLKLTTFLTDGTVAPGTHFSVVIDGVPEKNVHVYAPGVTGYKPLALTIDPQLGLIVRAIQYPKPQDYFFKPLNEHVPVYQKAFRVIQDLAIDPSRDAEAALRDVPSLTIKGALSYQACDDNVCFLPQSIPLTWTVNLKPLDRERASKPQ